MGSRERGIGPRSRIGSLLPAQRKPRRTRMLRNNFQRTEVLIPRTAAVLVVWTMGAAWSDVGLGVGLGRSSPVGSPVPEPSGPPMVVTGLATACGGSTEIPIARTASKLKTKLNDRIRAKSLT